MSSTASRAPARVSPGKGISGIAEIAEILPVQVIDPGVHRLIEEGSARRRRLLDWGVFHVKHEFLSVWRRYQRALQQRNAVLRANGDEQLLAAWERELGPAGHRVDTLRSEYAAQLLPYFMEIADSLLGTQGARFTYRRGWAAEQDLGRRTGRISLSRPATAHDHGGRTPRGRVVFLRGCTGSRPCVARSTEAPRCGFHPRPALIPGSTRCAARLPDARRSGGRARCG